ncbi:solute carrier family 22 member 5-like [Varroa destructor]|uniref:Major facilitator superfamily (MFS) profile domain-containing protein n=1 Tax=Varroa destructor TaxID=109461 RepID=A0A7M7MDZ7_VARDE|nr:solute carrier family 22 member 5-like [Varroa destructor]XP_022655029.1 solute carrier family 22 member 5-like [Varroa destructor]XP_022655030.1 solute carrier family 22 member 5-like [Varroa destructor]XP_022655032.1 solute carrier family 22 member 5-like [Varroa destructor]
MPCPDDDACNTGVRDKKDAQDNGKQATFSIRPNKGKPTLDDLFQRLGVWHIPIFLFGFLRGIPVTMLMMYVVFSAPTRQHYWCTNAKDDNNTVPDRNTCNGSCTSFEFDRTVYGYTIMEQYGLVCDRIWLASLAQSLYLWGLMVGGVLHAHISDWWGRKTVMAVSLVWTTIVSAITAFAPNIYFFIVGRFISACGVVGFAEAAFTLVVETVSPQQRYMPTLTIGTGWSTGMLILPLFAWFLRDWTYLQLLTAVTVLPLCALWFLVPESPRWQLSTGRLNEAEKNLASLVRNNSDYSESDVSHLVDERRKAAVGIRNGKTSARPTLFAVAKREYRTTTFVFTFCMAVSNLLWYYLTVSTTTVAESNPYLGYSLAALSEYPTKLINSALIKWAPRKRTLFVSFGCSCVVLVAVIFLPKECSWTKLGLLIMGKVCTSVNMSVSRVAISEAYPTVIRALAISLAATAGRIGSCIAPFFEELERASSWKFLPMGVIAGLCLFASILTRLLNETFEQPLPDNVKKDEGNVTNHQNAKNESENNRANDNNNNNNGALRKEA